MQLTQTVERHEGNPKVERYQLWTNAAEEYRRAKKYELALPLYESALAAHPHPKSGAGLLYCLRRLGRLEQAMSCLSQLRSAFGDDPLINAEAGWLRYALDLKPLIESGMLNNAALVAEEIINSSHDPSLTKKVVFSMLRKAKQKREWALISYFCDLIDPSTLSNCEPQGGNNSWSEQARWTEAKTLSLIKMGNIEEAYALAQRASEFFPKQRTLFIRWQGLALLELGRNEEAVALYAGICSGKRADWWLFQEYGQALRSVGRNEQALKVFCKGALGCGKQEMGVRLYEHLASCALEVGGRELAAATADLAIQIRQRQGWKVPATLVQIAADAGTVPSCPERERSQRCRQMWREVTGEKGLAMCSERSSRQEPSALPLDEAPPAERLEGHLLLGDKAKPFCFIGTEHHGRIFCLSAHLPEGAVDGALVSFRVIQSFDKKRQKNSWQAVELLLTTDAEGTLLAAEKEGVVR
jgi:tetratricopeptide (TPR) repeat protein